MKKLFYLFALLFVFACGSDETPEIEPEPPVDYSLLMGKWNFAYVTNTMTGNRSYTFTEDGHYTYVDEWTALFENNVPLSTSTEKKEGTFSLPVYTMIDSNSVEGEIIIDTKQMHFTITTTDYGIFLNLFGDNTYEKI